MNAQTETFKQRQYFTPGHLNEAKEYVKSVTKEFEKLPVHFNFDPDKDTPPSNYGILVQPVLERNKKKKGGPLQLAAVIVAQVPDIKLVSQDEKGSVFLQAALDEAYGRKLRTDLTQQLAAHAKVKLPATLEEFVASERNDNLFLGLMQETVRKLKQNGGSLSLLSVAILKNALMSASFAKGMFPRIPQEDWVKVIDRLAKDATDKGIDPTIINEWKANRDATNIDDVESITF
jgi:hypothetical protein